MNGQVKVSLEPGHPVSRPRGTSRPLLVCILIKQFTNRSSSAIAMAYHPGTVLTSFTSPIIGTPEPNPEKGVFTLEEAIEKMADVMKRANRYADEDGGGRFWDWRGDRLEW
jgi:hypothetical protein